jgi:S1-C subfamily serine protease
MNDPRGGLITAVAPESLGEDLGLRPGDRLVAVNGRPLGDLIDYLQELDGERIFLTVVRP